MRLPLWVNDRRVDGQVEIQWFTLPVYTVSVSVVQLLRKWLSPDTLIKCIMLIRKTGSEKKSLTRVACKSVSVRETSFFPVMMRLMH